VDRVPEEVLQIESGILVEVDADRGESVSRACIGSIIMERAGGSRITDISY